MCDTFIATPDYTKNNKMIFGKNSDREPNEVQSIIKIPARRNTEKQFLFGLKFYNRDHNVKYWEVSCEFLFP
ncbi:MAG: hypothetical protein K9H65_02175 [Bacteroidales bacterium]|nr:hypothetical protein [Bacteroidales bacterium]